MDLRFLENKKVLITGATGLLGGALLRKLQGACQVVAVGRKARSGNGFQYIQQDVTEPLQNFPEHIDYIIHAASNSDPANIAKYPVETLMTNVLGTKNLLDYGRSHGMERFLFVSSGEIYGQPDGNMSDFTEDYCGPLELSNPRSCYPEGKRAAEVLCQSYIQEYGVDAVIVRPCHLFGPAMREGDSHAAAQFLRQAARGEEVVLKSAGLLERSHCYTADAADAILLILRDGVSGEAYNVADRRQQMTVRAFAEQAAKAGGVCVVYEKPTGAEMSGYSPSRRMVLDTEKLERLGWKPETISAIQKTVREAAVCKARGNT